MPRRDTFRIRRPSDDEATARLDPPNRPRRREPQPTFLDLRKGRRDDETALDMGATMIAATRSEVESVKDRGRLRKRRRTLAISAAVLTAILVVAYLAAYGRDAEGAVGGDCVYDSGESALAPGHAWMTLPCALPSPTGESHLVLMRVEGSDNAAICAESLPSWSEQDDHAIIMESRSRSAVLCTTPRR